MKHRCKHAFTLTELLVLVPVAALVGTMLLTVATGWVASHRILGQKPLEVLREE